MRLFLYCVVFIAGLGQSSAKHKPNNFKLESTSSTAQLSTALECARPCRQDQPPKICHYEFTLELYTTLSRACEICSPGPNNTFTAQCQCVLADGVEKSIMSANRMIPGPSIYVCYGDKVVIDVDNHIEGNEVTIHWHGIFQTGSQYSDGVPFVTQCPIQEGTTFRYQFLANNAGTHFWHAHSGLHKFNGLFGSLIVREPQSQDIHGRLYEEDLLEHVILVNDWMHELMEERFPGLTAGKVGQDPEAILINGKGQTIHPRNGTLTNTPLEVFQVVPGKRYRFRFINSMASVCGAMITIQGHSLSIITTDGEPIKPVKVNSIVSFSGERYDFILNANQGSGSFWIQIKGLQECGITKIQQLAILSYGTIQQRPSAVPPTYDKALAPGIILNPVDSSCNGTDSQGICISQLVNAEPIESAICDNSPTVKLNASFMFRAFTPQQLFQPNQYRIFFVPPANVLLNSLINNITYVAPPSPLISQRRDIDPSTICSQRSKGETCKTSDCYCTNVEEVPFNSVVEIFIVDERGNANVSHPFHLHGQAFYVVAMGKFPRGQKITAKHVHKLDEKGLISRCVRNPPPGKDTIQIPINGYAIVRFVAKNPGYWFFHCHFLAHIAAGMDMVIHVKGPMPPVPPNFPKCGNFLSYINADPKII